MLDIIQLRTGLVGPVDLSLAQGECIAILGPSGSGKSLLLRAVADLDPNSGDVLLNGRSRNDMPAYQWRRLVSLVPAESGWWADRVAEHFKAKPDMSEMLKDVGLPDALGWQVSRLSSGERQRLALVRALQGGPQALLLDEPTAALDEASTLKVEEIMQRQLERGVIIVLVTHDPEQAGRLANKRITLKDGRIIDMPMTAA
ncbi:MAG TPA: ATP-binding cassette domain-containing protein [Hyphomicrobiales bacterium]|nr:ATP-binding cassette domain-containing protein [Hyphomicrobiales bacterium]